MYVYYIHTVPCKGQTAHKHRDRDRDSDRDRRLSWICVSPFTVTVMYLPFTVYHGDFRQDFEFPFSSVSENTSRFCRLGKLIYLFIIIISYNIFSSVHIYIDTVRYCNGRVGKGVLGKGKLHAYKNIPRRYLIWYNNLMI